MEEVGVSKMEEKKSDGIQLAAGLLLLYAAYSLIVDFPAFMIIWKQPGLIFTAGIFSLLEIIGLIVVALGLRAKRRWALYSYTVLVVLFFILFPFLIIVITWEKILLVLILVYLWTVRKRFS